MRRQAPMPPPLGRPPSGDGFAVEVKYDGQAASSSLTTMVWPSSPETVRI